MVIVSNKQIRYIRSHPSGSPLRLAILVLGAFGSSTVAAGQSTAARAHAAYRISGASTAYLHRVRNAGAEIIEEGTVYGALSGKAKARLDLGVTVSGSFTIYLAHGGAIYGHGSGALRNAGVYQAFSGSLSITGGSGRYTHAHGHGGFSGKINRRTYAVTLSTSGTLYY